MANAIMKSLLSLLAFALVALASPIAEGGTCPAPPSCGYKKIGYFWVGGADFNHSDFLAVYSLDDDSFGKKIAAVDVPITGNSAHHISASKDGKTLSVGGLLSFGKQQPSMYLFDITDRCKPTYVRSIKAPLSSATDEMRLMPDGGFMVSNMGSANGSSPGRVVEMDVNYNIIAEYPKDFSTLTSTGDPNAAQFSPHGLCLDPEKGIMISSDFVVPATILKPSTSLQHANTLRLWNLTERTIISTTTIANGSGINDVKFIPGNTESAAIATVVGLGQAWIFYPFRKDINGRQGVAEFLFDLGLKGKEAAIYLDITQDGRYAYFSLTLNSRVVQLDISDLSHPKRIDDPTAAFPHIGSHYLKIAPDQKHAFVIDYFVQTDDVGIVNTPADFFALYADIADNGALNFGKSIDFKGDFADRGGAKPHSVVFFDLTDPANPKWW